MRRSTVGPAEEKGTPEAERTNDILTIIQLHFAAMPEVPKAIAGHINGEIRSFPTLDIMIREMVWTDVGDDAAKCKGRQGQPTCHNNHAAKGTRIDVFIANEYLSPAVKTCIVDQLDQFPTHRPIVVEIATERMQKVTTEIVKPTNFATLSEEEVQGEVQTAQEEARKKQEKQGGNHEKKKKKKKKANGVDENKIR